MADNPSRFGRCCEMLLNYTTSGYHVFSLPEAVEHRILENDNQELWERNILTASLSLSGLSPQGKEVNAYVHNTGLMQEILGKSYQRDGQSHIRVGNEMFKRVLQSDGLTNGSGYQEVWVVDARQCATARIRPFSIDALMAIPNIEPLLGGSTLTEMYGHCLANMNTQEFATCDQPSQGDGPIGTLLQADHYNNRGFFCLSRVQPGTGQFVFTDPSCIYPPGAHVCSVMLKGSEK